MVAGRPGLPEADVAVLGLGVPRAPGRHPQRQRPRLGRGRRDGHPDPPVDGVGGLDLEPDVAGLEGARGRVLQLDAVLVDGRELLLERGQHPHQVGRAAGAGVPRLAALAAAARPVADVLRAPLQRVHVEEVAPVERHARKDGVVQGALVVVGEARLAGREQQPERQHAARDRRAGLGVGPVGRQLVGVAEGLVAVPGPERAGQVGARRQHVVEAPQDGGQERRVAGLDGDVDRPAVEVQLADGVPGHGRRRPDRSVVLPVDGAEAVLAEQAVTAPVELVDGQVEPAPLAGQAVQLDERHLDLGVPVDAVAPARAELVVDPGREPLGHRQQPPVAERPLPGDRRLEQVAGAVQLVAPLQVVEGPVGCRQLDVGVEVAVRPLGRGHQLDRRVGQPGELGVGPAAELPADGLEPLVDVGVQERVDVAAVAAKAGVGAAVADGLEVREVAGARELGVAVAQRLGPVAGHPLAPEAAAQPHPVAVERPQAHGRPGPGQDGGGDGRGGGGRTSCERSQLAFRAPFQTRGGACAGGSGRSHPVGHDCRVFRPIADGRERIVRPE